MPPAATGTPERSGSALAWFECELFCINDYAGIGGSHCGWRGRFSETRWDPTRRVRPCPRCGSASLMDLDFNRGRLEEI